nr:MAG TPA: hypothetical protein [Caudoviricetes sp.]DAS57886.1 MAG TPA: hypothetical protein [Caudoviricetes sp.]
MGAVGRSGILCILPRGVCAGRARAPMFRM